jgi:hypothetical protein
MSFTSHLDLDLNLREHILSHFLLFLEKFIHKKVAIKNVNIKMK